MTRSLLILRGLAHYWRWHLGLFLGVALTALVISGSLVTGDSVRATLARQSEIRLGSVVTAAAATDGFFTTVLAEKAGHALQPVLFLQGTVTEPGNQRRAGGVNLYGTQPSFWSLGQEKLPDRLAAGGEGVLLNRALASSLGLDEKNPGEVILRFEKPGFISRDAPLSGESDQTVTLRLKVDGIVPDEAMGAFSLAAGQTPPLNAWLPLPRLQEATQLQGRANLLLGPSGDKATVEAALDKSLTIEDAGLTLTGTGEHRVLSTSRIFLSEDIAATIRAEYSQATGVLTYLVNEIHGNGKITPYSMATATSPPDAAPGSGEVRVHQWLADDLALKPGDPITLKFFRVTRARQLEEAEASFKVGSIVPMTDPLVRRDWTPDFPGVSETENCRDWKPGIPIRQDIIRDKDDAYWKQYKGTPKLWLPLAPGQTAWANRFGSLTSFQIPGTDTAAISAKLAAALTPAVAGITVVDVKDAAARAVSDSMDFGLLFVSMSAFLIITALLLSALLFVFGIEHRAAQAGVLRASGWTGRQVRGLFLMEGLWISLPAAVLGVLGGRFYTSWTLGKLEGDWSDAALGLKFIHVVNPVTLGISAASTVLLALLVVWWSTRRLLKARPRVLLTGQVKPEKKEPARKGVRKFLGAIPRGLRYVPIGLATLGAGALLFYTPRVPQYIAPGLFFGAGFLLLVDGVRLLYWRLARSAKRLPAPEGPPSVWALGVRNTERRLGRSASLAGLLALGVFMITALNAFRQDARLTENKLGTGAGGFTFIGESTLPVYEDLNSNAGQKTWDFDPGELEGVRFLPFRVRDGEEASCLNLNRAQTPRILGVNPEAMPADAFPFASELRADKGWQALKVMEKDGAIDVIVDQISAMYAMGKGLGDTLEVPDSQGRPVKLRIAALLAGTVLQGNVVMDESRFVNLYPDTRGYRYFLIDAPAAKAESFRKLAVSQLTSRGFTLTEAPARLAQFQAVQNTYLTIFSTLGGMALLLSTAGLAVLVARHVLERRAEFSALSACGFLPRQLRLMVAAEHWFLLLAAVILGSVSAALAVWPNLQLAGAGGIPVWRLVGILAGLLAGGLVFCWLAARLAMRRGAEGLRG